MSRRILHTFANFKWTGPADPAIRCAVELRRLGADVCFAQAAWTLPGAEHRMAKELRRARLPVTGDLELRKHFHPGSHLRDARRLRERLRRGDFDVVHAHLGADHLIAALARRRLADRPVLVRSLYDPTAPRRTWRTRFAFRHTDGVVAPTEGCAEQIAERYGLERERVLYQDPPTDLRRTEIDGDLRGELGLAPGDFVVGITARVQPHRRFELLWQVARRVVDELPRARFVLLGRGSVADVERLVSRPVRDAGLEDCAVLPGYLAEPRYSLALKSLDLFLFLVPGSDGTCRAVREALAFGLPVVATRRGILPELLGEHPELAGQGPAGIACPEDPAVLARAILDVASDADRRNRLAAAGRARARGPMDPVRAARRLSAFYERLAGLPRRRGLR